ncbi:MAG TPA: MlaD family protein [Acetobacteraceae bacterium]|nr:MlaD family protein [Acetobacteraceae bacterium]
MRRMGRLYFGVGLLILVGLGLAVGFVLFLTSGRLTGDSLVFETYSQESVTGLDIGAPVRFRGVAIGRVTEIALASSLYTVQNSDLTAPEFRLVVLRFAVDRQRIGVTPSLDQALNAGLRVRIATQGITGVNYLELDFADPGRYPVVTLPWEPRYPVIPSVPSTVAQVTSAAERLVQRLDTIDFESLLGNLTGLLADLRRVAGSEDVARAVREAAEAMTTLRTAIAEADIAATLRDVREAARSVNETAEGAGRIIEAPELGGAVRQAAQAAADLRAAIARLPAAVQALETTLRAARAATTDTQADLVPLLRDLRATAANLRDVTEALRRSPSQVLLGAPPPPPQERR